MSANRDTVAGHDDIKTQELRKRIDQDDTKFRNEILKFTAQDAGDGLDRAKRWVKRWLAGEWKYWRPWPSWQLGASATSERDWLRIQIGLGFKDDRFVHSMRRFFTEPFVIVVLVVLTGFCVAPDSRRTCSEGSIAEAKDGLSAGADDAPAPNKDVTAAACKDPEHFNTKVAQFLLILLGFFAAGWRWKVGQQHIFVEDAMSMKDRTNTYISDNAEKIAEFVDTSFFELPRKEIPTRKDTIVKQLFVYKELDTLESVYDKARQDLMGDEYVPRALKIFGVRGQDPEFRKLAEHLIEVGRYNTDFKLAVRLLLRASEKVAPPEEQNDQRGLIWIGE